MIRVELTQEIFQALQSHINQVRGDGQHIVLTYDDQELLALVPLADLEVYYDLEDGAEVRLIEKDLTESGGPVPLEDFKRGLGL